MTTTPAPAAPGPESPGRFTTGRVGNQPPMRSVLRRHPSGVALGAWFDGERGGDVGAHVARCRRCRRHADALAALRSMLRPTPSPRREPAGRRSAGG